MSISLLMMALLYDPQLNLEIWVSLKYNNIHQFIRFLRLSKKINWISNITMIHWQSTCSNIDIDDNEKNTRRNSKARLERSEEIVIFYYFVILFFSSVVIFNLYLIPCSVIFGSKKMSPVINVYTNLYQFEGFFSSSRI